MDATHQSIGTESTRWNLADLYESIGDPKLDEDIARLAGLCRAFRERFRSRLHETLGDAVDARAEVAMLANRIGIYVRCLMALDPTDAAVKAKKAEMDRILDPAMAEGFAFFDIEMCGLSDEVIERLCRADARVGRHRPWIREIRKTKPHLLSENVEEALAKRGSFGSSAWHEFYDELETMLDLAHRGEAMSLGEILHVVAESPDPAERAEALKTVNDAMKGWFAAYGAQALYVTAGEKAVEDRERKYAHPMSARNEDNRVPDAVVEALHAAAREVAGPICRDWYGLKGEMLGIRPLRWSDRNANLPFQDNAVIPFTQAKTEVIAAYRRFSPALAGIVEDLFARGRVDAHNLKPREGGAWCNSGVMPGGRPFSCVFMTYLGARGDAMTLAHELGHAVHGILAGEAQGALMDDAPIAYCETASIFGEMLNFDYQLEKLRSADDARAALCLAASKADGMMNTVVRQISFSEFERRLHGTPKKMSARELAAVWMDVTRLFYGADGEVFRYEDMDNLWAYISHFHRPFYVYGYAFGELLTQSLYAVRDRFGANFEPMYLDLLRAGGTKDASELLKPFGLDPTNPDFWAEGIRTSMGRMTAAAREFWNKVK